MSKQPTTTRTYRYGAREPLDSGKVLEQMRLANIYRNKLVEIELERRKQRDEYLLSQCPQLVACEKQLADAENALQLLVEQQKRANAKARTKTDTSESKAAIAEARIARRELWKSRKTLRSELFADGSIKAGLSAIDETSKAAIRKARAECCVFWGSYLLVEDSAEQFRIGQPPRFKSWNGEGRIGVQIQNGMTWEQLTSGNDTRARMERAGWNYSHGRKLASRKTQEKRRILFMRVGSDGRKPIWARIPVIIHRDPPDGVNIKWIILHRLIVAGRPQYHVTFSLEGHPSVFRPKDIAASGSVGIDIGYRVMPSGRQRVAIAYGSDGQQHDLYLPHGKLGEWDKVERIQGHRDTMLEEAKGALIAWLADNPDCPEWLKLRCATLHAWRNCRRLDDLVWEWSRTTGVPNDEVIIERLEAWRQRERHLWQYQEHLRQQLLDWRKDYYRNWCAMLRKRYRTAYIEDMDLRDAIHDTLVPEDLREVMTEQRRAANRVALSTLVNCLKNCGMECHAISPEHTTQDCHKCGHRNDYEHPEQLKQKCGKCGAEYDQDENAARVILARGEAAAKERESLANNGDEVKPSRYERRTSARKRKIEPNRHNELE